MVPENSKILIADDDEALCYLLKEELVTDGFAVDIVYDGREAIESLKLKNYDLLLLDLEMKDVSGNEVLSFVKDEQLFTQVIILTAKSEIRTAINCIQQGAYDFIPKPYEFGQLRVTIKRALEHKKLLLENQILSSKVSQVKLNKIIGNSEAILSVTKLAQRAANSDSNILLQGETGTGKELFAEYIHKHSQRNDKPFVAINCASLPDQLIESELFGYEKGAFTDAKTKKQGLVEIADGGTLFLDEIGELSLTLQPKLLRFLEKGEFRRIGGIVNLKSNVKIIGATNKNLMEEAEKGTFRRDLLFRLNVITLTVPPLRERNHDILTLANYFIEKKSSYKAKKKLSPEAEKALLYYSFPGNVRELEHIIERALIFSDSDELKVSELALPTDDSANPVQTMPQPSLVTIEELEKVLIKNTLQHFDWNRENSARSLGISQKTLYTKIKKYEIRP
jgi:two-component system, NtrC family, response regulator AtoC